MTLVDRITEETRSMPAQAQQQVLDFALFLKEKQKRELADDMNAVIRDNLEAFKELAK